MFLVLGLLVVVPLLAFELLLRHWDTDRRVPVTTTTIDNTLYHTVDWWSPTSDMRALHAMTKSRVDYFFPLVREADVVLDVGCGAGFVAIALGEKGVRVQGIDPSGPSLEQARAQANIRGLENVSFFTGSAARLDVPDGSIQAMVMADVLEHIEDLPGALDEVARVLAPGGVFVFDTINRTRWSYLLTIFALQHLGLGGICPPNTHDWSMYITPDELTEMLTERGLVVGEIQGLVIQPTPSMVYRLLTGGNLREDEFTIGADTSANYIGHAVKQSV